MKNSKLRQILYKEIQKIVKEIEFADKTEFQKYKAKHKMRDTTKVKIAGKDTTVGDADKKSSKKKKGGLPGINGPPHPDSLAKKGGTTKGPGSVADALGTDPAKERAIISGIQKLIHTGKDVDLCSLSVPGTNLFCKGNKGIPRSEMPQFKSKPVAGGYADKLRKVGKLSLDDNGEVDTEELFLKSIGKKAKHKKVKVVDLKATQNQIVGKKVSLFLNQLQNGDPNSAFTKALNEPIIVSSDGYVVDGHHRWAALVAQDLANGGDGDIKMKVKSVSEPIESLIKKSNNFTKKVGLETKSGGKKK